MENAFTPTLFKFEGRTIFLQFAQEKAYSPILSTLSGIRNLRISLFAKAQSPILFNPSGKLTSCKLFTL